MAGVVLQCSVAESIGFASAAAPNEIHAELVADAINSSPTADIKGVALSLIGEDLALELYVLVDGSVWECWVLQSNELLATIYSGMDFNGYCVFENAAYGSRDDGIYVLTGALDGEAAIHTGVEIGPTNFGTTRRKRIRRIYLGKCGNNVTVTASVDDGTEETFAVVKGAVTLPRNLVGREWTLKISDFERLDMIELLPVILER